MIMNLIAWDPIDKKMGVVETYHPRTGKVMFENDSWDWYKRDRIVRRPTGLKDRNGKEIFEGDFVQTNDGGEIFLDVVKWSDKDAAWEFENVQGLCTVLANDIDLKRAEVIGDIYTNPELLEEESV